jgi:hypothetical protein
MTRLIGILTAGGLLTISPVCSSSSALADAFTDQYAALDVIKKTADDVCYHIDQQGSRSSAEISGEAGAAINAAIAKLADLHIKGVGKYETEESKGVLQKDLATVIKSSIDCRLDVFNTLANKMLGWRPPPSQDTINQLGRYINEGGRIANIFQNTKDVPMLKTQYENWSSNVAMYLGQTLDTAYAAQFRNAQPINSSFDGMPFNGGGIWQELRGQLLVLGQIVNDIRHQ